METPQEQITSVEPAENKQVVAMNIDETAGAVKSAANWFYWIAALSFLNTLLLSKGTYFIMGLAFTQLVDGMVMGVTGEVNYFVSAIVPLLFVGIGVLAGRLMRWAFILGAVLYLIDGLMYILFQEWLAILFHAYVLYRLYVGYKLITEYEALKQQLSIGTETLHDGNVS